MRITNQMMQNTAKRTGIPLQQNTLLDIMNKSSSSTGGMLPSVGTTKSSTNAFLEKINSESRKELKYFFGEIE